MPIKRSMFSFFIEPFDISFVKSSSQVCQKITREYLVFISAFPPKNVEHTVK